MSGTTLRGVGTGPKATSAPGLLGFASSTLGAKAIVAVTGLLLVGFVVQHLAGNLLIYAGPEATNAYAATLKGLAERKISPAQAEGITVVVTVPDIEIARGTRTLVQQEPAHA